MVLFARNAEVIEGAAHITVTFDSTCKRTLKKWKILENELLVSVCIKWVVGSYYRWLKELPSWLKGGFDQTFLEIITQTQGEI